MYAALLAEAPVTEQDFLDAQGDGHRARDGLDRLLDLGLVRRGEQGVLELPPPRAAIEEWARHRELEASLARRVGDGLAQLYVNHRGLAGGLVELVEGLEASRDLFTDLQLSTRTQVRSLDREPYLEDSEPSPDEVQLDAMRRGVKYRAVYETNVLHLPNVLQGVREGVAAGEEARVFPDVPLKLLIFDDDRALVPLVRPGADDYDALLVFPSALLTALTEVFEAFWRLGAPIHETPNASDASPMAPEPSAETQRLLALLTGGLTDESIARSLGLSERTITRRVHRLQELLGARTRFQLGVQATRRGWL